VGLRAGLDAGARRKMGTIMISSKDHYFIFVIPYSVKVTTEHKAGHLNNTNLFLVTKNGMF
jgi:hypothetical protein